MGSRFRKPRRPIVIPIVVSGVLALAWSGVVKADDVSLIPGTVFKQAIGGKVKGQVQSESPSEVVVVLGATTTNVPVDQIASIRYDGQSATYTLAEAREANGQLAEAADLFKKAAAEAAGKPFPLQAALFREAEVLTDLALIEPDRSKEAKDRLTRFVQAYPNGRHIAAARGCLARLQLNAGDFKGAEATIAELAKIPKAGERAAVLKTKILARQGKHAEAIAELDRLIASYPKGSERQRDAMLAKAESLAGAKQFKEAETLVRQVIQANPPEDAAAQAPAYNTLGDCLRAADRTKEALIAYLHTDLLYSKDKEEHPRALHQIAALFRKLNQDGRADEFAKKLKDEYPRSPWVVARSADQ
jgi:TolA-binding protein